MNHKDAVIQGLKQLGGRAKLKDIYFIAFRLSDFSGSQNPKNTLRNILLTHPELFRNPEHGVWELISYQEEIASRDRRISELEAENASLRAVRTEDDFVQRMMAEIKELYKHEKDKLAVVRQVMKLMMRNEACQQLDEWIEGKATPHLEQHNTYNAPVGQVLEHVERVENN